MHYLGILKLELEPKAIGRSDGTSVLMAGANHWGKARALPQSSGNSSEDPVLSACSLARSSLSIMAS